jgi:hypothetical protein
MDSTPSPWGWHICRSTIPKCFQAPSGATSAGQRWNMPPVTELENILVLVLQRCHACGFWGGDADGCRTKSVWATGFGRDAENGHRDGRVPHAERGLSQTAARGPAESLDNFCAARFGGVLRVGTTRAPGKLPAGRAEGHARPSRRAERQFGNGRHGALWCLDFGA